MIFAVYVLLGVVAACVHFGLLRWNAALYARKRGIAAACAVQALRLAGIATLLWWLAMQGAAPLLLATLGLLAARPFLMRALP
jgi:hypothetical protein